MVSALGDDFFLASLLQIRSIWSLDMQAISAVDQEILNSKHPVYVK